MQDAGVGLYGVGVAIGGDQAPVPIARARESCTATARQADPSPGAAMKRRSGRPASRRGMHVLRALGRAQQRRSSRAAASEDVPRTASWFSWAGKTPAASSDRWQTSGAGRAVSGGWPNEVRPPTERAATPRAASREPASLPEDERGSGSDRANRLGRLVAVGGAVISVAQAVVAVRGRSRGSVTDHTYLLCVVSVWGRYPLPVAEMMTPQKEG
jgi:hypothetical protein